MVFLSYLVLTEQCKVAYEDHYNQLYKTHDACLQFYNGINKKYKMHKPDTNIVFLQNVGTINHPSIKLLPPINGKQRIVFHLQNIHAVDDLIKCYQ